MALIKIEAVFPTLSVEWEHYWFDVIFEYTLHSLTRLATESALLKRALSSVVQGVLVWPDIKIKATKH